MNDFRPPEPADDDVDRRYRRDSQLDPSRPREPVRTAILEHAARLAAERVAPVSPPAVRPASRARGRRASWRRPAAAGTLAAAVLAGLLVVPRFVDWHSPPAAPGPVSASSDRLEAPAAPTAAASAKSAMPSAMPRTDIDDVIVSGQRREAAPRRPAEAMLAAPPPFTPVPANTPAPEAAPKPEPKPEPTQAMKRSIDQTVLQSARAMRAGPQAAPAPMMAGNAALRAATQGDIPQLQTLFDAHAELDARDASGRTALMLAVLNGRSLAVEWLLAHGADPNAADASGNTPLHAAAGGDPAIIAALRRAGAHE